MSIDAGTPLNLKPRSSINVDNTDLEGLMRSGNGELLARIDWEAKTKGDLTWESCDYQVVFVASPEYEAQIPKIGA